MPGIENIQNITIENVTSIANITIPTDFFVNVNNMIYNGYLYFILLILAWYILALSYYNYKKSIGEDDILNSIFVSGGVITILSILMRGIEILQNGVVKGLLSDYLMWIFPLITVILGLVIYSTSD